MSRNRYPDQHRVLAVGLALACMLATSRSTASAQQAAPPPVWGFADLHVHQFANLGLGGLLLWGSPFSPDDIIATALPYSDFYPTGSDLGKVQGIFGAPVVPLPLPSWRPGCPARGLPCLGVNIHGPFGTLDLLNLFLTGILQHNVGGGIDEPPHLLNPADDPAPDLPFDGWPAYNVLTGQQVYYEWLERAWRAGQRLMVMLAVNNQALCQATFHLRDFGCEDMPAIERQIQAAKDLETFIDAKSGGNGWYRIVYSPAQARQVITEGKLAVVLGIEAPSLLGCKDDGDCAADDVRSGVQHLYDIGVRHIFPVHNADNAFGGTALYNEVFDFNNAVITGEFWELMTCPADQDMEFRVTWRDTAHFLSVAAAIARIAPVGPFGALALYATSQYLLPALGPAGAHCNTRGLTDLGEVLIDEMMKHEMLIDVDHTSTRTFNAILDRAKEAKYPGIVSSHTGILGVSSGENRHEGQKTDEQLERIRYQGGLVGVILHQGGHDRISQYERGSRTVPLVCGDTTDAWLQAYLYTVDRMNGGAVALGSDLNGFAGVPGPRTDPGVCGAGEIGQLPLVSYPFNAFGASGEEFHRQQIGQRVIDYNYQGMATVGQLPDFIEEARQLLPVDSDLNPLFGSAEAYVRMWERVADTTPPMVACSAAPTGWQGANVAVACTATDWPSGLARASDASFTLTTSVAAEEETVAQTGTYEVCDTRGNCATVGPFTAMIDRKAPAVTIASPLSAQYPHAGTLTLDYGALDGGSGLKTLTATMDGQPLLMGHGLADGQTIDLLTELGLGQHTFEVLATDAVGNGRTGTVRFQLVVTPESIRRAVDAFYQTANITKAGLRQALLDQLAEAEAYRDAGDCATAAEKYRAIIKTVEAQSGKAISPTAAAILIADAQYLIDHCP